MIEFLVDNINVRFGGQLFRQMVGIPMGTNCAPLLADLFFYSYYLDLSTFIVESGVSYIRVLTICLLLVYFVSAAGCHCFDFLV